MSSTESTAVMDRLEDTVYEQTLLVFPSVEPDVGPWAWTLTSGGRDVEGQMLAMSGEWGSRTEALSAAENVMGVSLAVFVDHPDLGYAFATRRGQVTLYVTVEAAP